ncbi:hypothetical protein VPH35_104597 [Triticum aestivum]
MPHLYNHPSHHRVGACWRLRAAREETVATLTTSNSFCCHHRSVMADTGCRRPRHTRSGRHHLKRQFSYKKEQCTLLSTPLTC